MIVLLNKPYGVLSQFQPARRLDSAASDIKKPDKTLADFIQIPDIYAAGRLDKDSEGLLVLTDDGALQHQITQPDKAKAWSKTYWVQVEGLPDEQALATLREGVALNDGLTRPAKARLITEPVIWPRQPPIRQRQNISTCWISLTLTEGRNRQVRRMTAAVGHPTLRLIRYRIGSWTIDGLGSGQFLII